MTTHESIPFGDLLRRHRIFAGLSQEELAARASLSARAISDLERGVKRAPRRDTVQLLIEALQLSGDTRAAFVGAAREAAVRPRSPQGTPPGEDPGASQAPASPHRPIAPAARPALGAAPPVGGFLGAVPQGTLVGREAELAATLAAVAPPLQ